MDAHVGSPASAAISVTTPPSVTSSDRATVFIVRLVCLFGLLLANYYSWTMTVTGFVNTKFFPDNSVLPNTYIPHIVASVIQLGILAFYLSIPYFRWRRMFATVIAICFAIILIGVSAVFALFSITYTFQSENIVSYQFDLVRGMNKKIVDLDESISVTFNSHLDALDVLSRRACEGKDRSQIAKCGPISIGYVEKANKARAVYGSQLGVHGAYSNLVRPTSQMSGRHCAATM
jgi:hypothetical protein